MNSTLSASIRKVWSDVHAPKGLPFPVTVQRCLELGVERYHVDYVAKTITAYVGTAIDVAPVHLEAADASAEWDIAKIKEALRLVQSGAISYQEFSRGVIDGGVTNYWAFLKGKRVLYIGKLGDYHVEWFPGAQPKTD